MKKKIRLKHMKWHEGILRNTNIHFNTLEEAIEHSELLDGRVKIYENDRIIYECYPVEYIKYA